MIQMREVVIGHYYAAAGKTVLDTVRSHLEPFTGEINMEV